MLREKHRVVERFHTHQPYIRGAVLQLNEIVVQPRGAPHRLAQLDVVAEEKHAVRGGRRAAVGLVRLRNRKGGASRREGGGKRGGSALSRAEHTRSRAGQKGRIFHVGFRGRRLQGGKTRRERYLRVGEELAQTLLRVGNGQIVHADRVRAHRLQRDERGKQLVRVAERVRRHGHKHRQIRRPGREHRGAHVGERGLTLDHQKRRARLVENADLLTVDGKNLIEAVGLLI